MNEEPRRRTLDQGVVGVAANAAKLTSRTFWQWFNKNHIDSILVLAIILLMSYQVLRWAFNFPYDVMVDEHAKYSGTDVAAILAALLGPWSLMQAGLVKWYMEMRAKANGNSPHQPGATP